jgi:hypothetical protein
MTVEATLAKLAFMLGRKYTQEQIVKYIRTDIRGELSEQVLKSHLVFQRPPESFM